MQRYVDPTFFDNDPETLGFDWGNVIGRVGAAGAATGLQLLFGQGQQGGGDQQGNCLVHSVECIDGLVVEYNNQMSAARAAGATPQQMIDIVNAALQILSDPAVFRQDGDAYLTNTKSQMQAKIAELRSMITPAATQVVTDPATGQQVAVPATQTQSSQLISGVNNSTLLLVAAGMAGVYFLTRQ